MERNGHLMILVLVRFLTMVGFGIIIPVLPFMVKDLGGSALMMGLFVAIYSVMQFIFSPVWGKWSDAYGRKPILMIGLVGYGLTFIFLGMAHHIWILILIRAISGILSSATLPTTMAYVSDIGNEKNRARDMGFVGAATGVGMIIGPGIGGILSNVSYAFPFYMAGILSLLIVPVAAIFLPESLQKSQRKNSHLTAPLSFEIIKDPLMIYYGINFAMLFVSAMFETNLAYLGAVRIGLDPHKMGIIFMVVAICSAVVQIGIIGKMVKRLGEEKIILIGIGISAFGMAGIALGAYLGSFVGVFAAIICYSIGSALVSPANASLVSQQEKISQGLSMGYYSSMGSLGRMIGPILGGALYEMNMYSSYVLGALSLIVLMVFFEKMGKN